MKNPIQRHLLTLLILGFAAASSSSQGQVPLVGPTTFYSSSNFTITEGKGGFTSSLADETGFGQSITLIGDVDGDGVSDLAVGAVSPFNMTSGAVWILFLNADWTVREEVEITEGSAGFSEGIHLGFSFGISVAAIGDLDGDGVVDLAVGSPYDVPAVPNRGSVWILFLRSNGSVKSHAKIDSTNALMAGAVSKFSVFGSSLAFLGDSGSGGVAQLAVGAPGDDEGPPYFNAGAVWILGLAEDGGLSYARKLSPSFPSMPAGYFVKGMGFGTALAAVGDLDGNGVSELSVGHMLGNSVRTLFFDPSGSVISYGKIKRGPLGKIGASLANIGDLDGDGVPELLESHSVYNGSFEYRATITFLNADGTDKGFQLFGSNSAAGSQGVPASAFRNGAVVARLEDADGNGYPEIAFGDPNYAPEGALRRGAVRILGLAAGVAQVTGRNGTGINEFRMTTNSLPALGSDLVVDLDSSGHSPGSVVFLVTSAPHPGLVTPYGELLVDPHTRLAMTVGSHGGKLETRSIGRIPNDPSFVGTMHLQALILGTPGPDATNALDLVIGG